MKILFLTPQLPHPPKQGTALRNWGLISQLARRGHRIVLLSFDGDGAPPSGELRAACQRVEAIAAPVRSPLRRMRTLLASPWPDMAERLWSPAFARRLRALIAEEAPDVIQIEGIELARYAFDPALDGIPLVFDDHNCEYLLQKRAFEVDRARPARWHAAAYSSVQWRRLRDFERRILRRASAVLCVSHEDQALLRALAPDTQPHVIYNGIDVDAYAAFAPAAAKDGAPLLLFTGKMDYRPNIDAALWLGRSIFPLVRRHAPGCRLRIVGQKPSPRLDVLRTDPAIEITGAVDDIRPHIAAATVYAAPLLAGGGTRFKLLEAMAMRKAIVSTTQGCEGFAEIAGRGMRVADTTEDFARAIAQLIDNPDQRRQLGEQAYRDVSATYDWSRIIPALERVYGALKTDR